MLANNSRPEPDLGVGLWVVEDTVNAVGETHLRCFETDPSTTIKATLVWTDPVGSLGASIQLVNDLDLTISVQGKRFGGCVARSGTSYMCKVSTKRQLINPTKLILNVNYHR